MRTPLAAFALLSLAACTSTFAEPRLLVSPYLAVYRLGGDIAMQPGSAPSGAPIGSAQGTRAFGLDRHREDFGIRADLGDGFAGLRLDYYRLDHSSGSRIGTVQADAGNLVLGDEVRTTAAMDELRLAWLEPLFTAKTNYRDRPLTVRMAAGAMLTHRDLALRVTTLDGTRSQNTDIDGNTASAAVRLRVGWRDFGFEGDYAICPGVALGGDFEKLQHDVEVRATYTVPLHDVTLFAGYRYSRMQAEGNSGGFDYDADLTLDGFQVGVSLVF